MNKFPTRRVTGPISIRRLPYNRSGKHFDENITSTVAELGSDRGSNAAIRAGEYVWVVIPIVASNLPWKRAIDRKSVGRPSICHSG